MKKFKSILGLVVSYLLLLSLLPANVLTKNVQASEVSLPKFLNIQEGYISNGVQYKDNTILTSYTTSTFYSKETSKTLNKLGFVSAYTEKTAVSYDANSLIDMNTGNVSLLENDSTYKSEKNSVIKKYKTSSQNVYIQLYPIKSTGDVQWSVYKLSYFDTTNKMVSYIGYVNSKLNIFEISTDSLNLYQLVYGSSTYKDDVFFNYRNTDNLGKSINTLLVSNADGTLKKYSYSNDINIPTGSDIKIYCNSDGIYLSMMKSEYSDTSQSTIQTLQKVKIKDNIIVADGSAILSIDTTLPFKLIATDINNNLWYTADGYVYKLENNSFVMKYEVDKNMNGLYVYDDNHLTVSGYNYATNKGLYTIINTNIYQGKKGWTQENGKWKYYDNGNQSAGWKAVANRWYHFNSSGEMETGWIKDGNKWYYMSTSGDMQSGWIKSGNKWYYMSSSGDMQIGWVKHGNTWYYMDSNGEMQTGWVKSGKTWYFMGDAGDMKTGWLKLGSSWYYLNTDGTMATGWTKVNNVSYYLDSNGVWVK